MMINSRYNPVLVSGHIGFYQNEVCSARSCSPKARVIGYATMDPVAKVIKGIYIIHT